MLFEKPDKLIQRELSRLRRSDRLSPDLVFRDPYVLDFLGLKDTHAERDLETAILREMESFLLELGVGFTFVARQKRMTIGGRDHYLDLLFYHRGLKRLVALDLKLGAFAPADKAQMELYLAWLRENEQPASEAPPIGLILCAGKDEETIRLLDLERGHPGRGLLDQAAASRRPRKKAPPSRPSRPRPTHHQAGLSMLSQLFAARLGPDNIPVYEVRPGVIMTDMTAGVTEKYDKLI